MKLVKDGSDMRRFFIKCKDSSSRVLHHLETLITLAGKPLYKELQ